MAWLWSGAHNTVTCFYCNSLLDLVPSAPSSARAAKGKTDTARVAVGSRDDFWCAVCGQITRRGEVSQFPASRL